MKKQIEKIFTNQDCYIVGSWNIKGIESNDIDILVLFDEPITITQLQAYRKELKKLGEEYQLIPNFKKDNKNLTKEFPYYNIKTGEKSEVKRKDLTDEEYDVLKNRLYSTLSKRQKFFDSLIDDRAKQKELTLEERIKKLEDAVM